MFLNKKIIIALLLLSFSTYCQEREKDSARITSLDEVVVTGQLRPQSIKKSIFEVKVITRKDIERRAGNNLADVLNQLLNIDIFQNASNGKSDINVLGLDGKYFKILLDNIPIINEEGFGNYTDLTLINLEDVERIELVQGAMGVQYGANSLSGVLNIITRKKSNNSWEIQTFFQEETVGKEYEFFNQGRHIQSISVGHQITAKKDKIWHLTGQGKEFGGETFFSKKYGDFIIWPPNFNPLDIKSSVRTKLINATKIGEALKVSSRRVNRVFAELGWLDKGIKGWNVTKIGRNLGGVEYDHDTGGTYVLWPEELLNNTTLKEALYVNETNNNSKADPLVEEVPNSKPNIRDKWPTPYRTKDGHRVRSRGEQMIDDYLYECGIVHAYEREVKNINEKVLCDFFIPAKSGGEPVYIEYWGKEDEQYDLRKKEKKDIYLNNSLNLIELENKHIYSLDDHLPRLLLKFKIRVD